MLALLLAACGDSSSEAPAPVCGNGIVEANEWCDDGVLADNGDCRPGCVPAACGDGVVAPSEQCDDGNLASGDGCNSACQRRAHDLWSVPIEGSPAIVATTSDGTAVVGSYASADDVAAGKPLLRWFDPDGNQTTSLPASALGVNGFIEPGDLTVLPDGTVVFAGGWRPSQSVRHSAGLVVAARPGRLEWVEADGSSDTGGVSWRAVAAHPAGVALAGVVEAENATVGRETTRIVEVLAGDGTRVWQDGSGSPTFDDYAGALVVDAAGNLAVGGRTDEWPWMGVWSAAGELSYERLGDAGLAVRVVSALGFDTIGRLVSIVDEGTQQLVGFVDQDGAGFGPLVAVPGLHGGTMTSDGRLFGTGDGTEGAPCSVVIVDPATRAVTSIPIDASSASTPAVQGRRAYVLVTDGGVAYLRAIQL